MPSKSQKQHDFFQKVYDDPEFRKKVGVSKKTAKEFLDADKKAGLWQRKSKEKTPKPKVSKEDVALDPLWTFW